MKESRKINRVINRWHFVATDPVEATRLGIWGYPDWVNSTINLLIIQLNWMFIVLFWTFLNHLRVVMVMPVHKIFLIVFYLHN